MIRILLVGGTGQVGWELRRTLSPLGEVEAPGRGELDLREPDGIRSRVRSAAPDLIVNAAAYTDVDRAESESEAARSVNAVAPGVLAEEAAEVGAALVHFSTDYVFDGEKGAPYVEDDPPDPLNVYGRTKREGEEAVRSSGAPHLVVRTSWVYGLRRRSFLTTMLEQLRASEVVRGVVDRAGSPTWCRALAEATAGVLARAGATREAVVETLERRGGTYHLSAPDAATRHAFAAEILAVASSTVGYDVRAKEVREATAADFESVARRPRNSALDCRRAEAGFGVRLPGWREQLRLCLEGRPRRPPAAGPPRRRHVR